MLWNDLESGSKGSIPATIFQCLACTPVNTPAMGALYNFQGAHYPIAQDMFAATGFNQTAYYGIFPQSHPVYQPQGPIQTGDLLFQRYSAIPC